ncbi:MAG: putative system TPR-repeat lipoprotein [Verrucomicrobiales bacterium]|nr:putative system TPR-repeat lipoprotein [Verrucomicrobiales bacterium]
MSRFGNLEFDQNSEESVPQGIALKDEGHYYALANTHFESGRFEPALRAFAKVLEYNPRNVSAWVGQIRMLIELNEYQEAKGWAEKALATFPDESELLAANAVCLARLGDLKAALTFSDASIEERGDSPYVWLARGDVLMARKEKRADYCFEKAIGFAPQDWIWSWLVSRVYSVYRNFAKALRVAQQALARDAARAVVWLQLGRCELALGLVSQAQVSLQHARELDDELEDIHRVLVEAGEVGLVRRIGRAWRRLFQP